MHQADCRVGHVCEKAAEKHLSPDVNNRRYCLFGPNKSFCTCLSEVDDACVQTWLSNVELRILLCFYVCVCACAGVWGCVCIWVGVPFPHYFQTICKAGCWSQAEAHGTAGAPPWLINAVPRTSSPREWRQKPHNAQPECYAFLSLSVDRGPAPVLSWGRQGAKREVRTQTNYHFMTKRFLCRCYIIDLPFRGRSLWSSLERGGIKWVQEGFRFGCICTQSHERVIVIWPDYKYSCILQFYEYKFVSKCKDFVLIKYQEQIFF